MSLTWILKDHKIWSNAIHNGWAGMTKYKGKFYIALRESAGHETQDGSVRILESVNDGNTFQSIGLIPPPNDPTYPEHGEPILSVTPKGKLRLFTRSSNSAKSYDSNVWITEDPTNFGNPISTGLGGILNTWGGMYAPNGKYYRTVWNHPDLGNSIFKLEESTNDEATSFITKVSELIPNVSANELGETGFGFLSNGKMIFVTRNSRVGNDPFIPAGKFGISTDDKYTDFIITDVDRKIEHPEILVFNDDTILLGTRGFQGGSGGRSTEIYELNIKNATTKLRHLFRTYNASDCASPNFLYEKDTDILNIVYYDGLWAGQVDIYFTQISKPSLKTIGVVP